MTVKRTIIEPGNCGVSLTRDSHVPHDDVMSEQPAHQPAVPRWTLGWRLQRALAHGGVSVHEMASELQVSRGTLSRWMADRGPDPRDVYLKQWALRTGVPYPWLCHGDLSPCDYRPRRGLSGVPSSKMHSTPTVNRVA